MNRRDRDRIRIRVYVAPLPAPDLLAESAAREEHGQREAARAWTPAIPRSAYRADGDDPDPAVFGPPRAGAQLTTDQEK